jgi:hypothetical protein
MDFSLDETADTGYYRLYGVEWNEMECYGVQLKTR